MGLKPSPFNATKAFAWAEEVVRGDSSDKVNLFHCNRVRLSLPGVEECNLALPWVSKIVDSKDGSRIASDFFSYINDIRTCGQTEGECWRASRQVATTCSYLRIQDAPENADHCAGTCFHHYCSIGSSSC